MTKDFFSLQWEGSEGESGKAFYKREWGEFALALNILPDRPYYLKAVKETEKKILYRAEAILKKENRFIRRLPVGNGVLVKDGTNKIIINLDPFQKRLILTL